MAKSYKHRPHHSLQIRAVAGESQEGLLSSEIGIGQTCICYHSLILPVFPARYVDSYGSVCTLREDKVLVRFCTAVQLPMLQALR